MNCLSNLNAVILFEEAI